MSQSLSVILPICNAEDRLAPRVLELLEITADLTRTVELLIVDVGSTDNTEEIAAELCRRYPQVRLWRHSCPRDSISAAKAGIEKTDGDIVLIHDIESPLSEKMLRRLWEMRDKEDLVFARSESAHDGPRASGIGDRRDVRVWSGTQMLRRRAIAQLQQTRKVGQSSERDRLTLTDSIAATGITTVSDASVLPTSR